MSYRTTDTRSSSPGALVLLGGARTAAEAFAGHAIAAEPAIRLPGRLERRTAEIRDGAHNPAGARWLADALRPERYVLVVSVLRDKDADALLSELATLGDTLVATMSSNPRSLAAGELASSAARHFEHVEAVESPHAALARAHELGEQVLVTGSLYLLADLEST